MAFAPTPPRVNLSAQLLSISAITSTVVQQSGGTSGGSGSITISSSPALGARLAGEGCRERCADQLDQCDCFRLGLDGNAHANDRRNVLHLGRADGDTVHSGDIGRPGRLCGGGNGIIL